MELGIGYSVLVFIGNQHFITFEPLAQTWPFKMWRLESQVRRKLKHLHIHIPSRQGGLEP
jgi:galactose-1-phosphate uridylyltransferase